MFLSKQLKQYEKPVLFGIVILIALTFGISSQAVFVSDPRGSEPAIRYFGKTLTTDEWQAFVGRWRVLYSMLIPNQSIPDKALHEEAKRALLALHQAEQAGIEVSDGEVARFVTKLLDRGGRFTPENYLAALKSRRVRVEDFEETVRDLLKIDKHSGVARDSASVTLSRVFDEYVKQNEELCADLVVFRAKDAAQKVGEITGAEVARQFAAQKERYQIPERVQIAYAMASHETLEKELADPGDEELTKFYEAHKEDYVVIEPIVPEKHDEPVKDGAGSGDGKSGGDGKTVEPPKDESGKDSDKDGEPDGKDAPPATPAQPEKKYKPFAEVRADVLKRWRVDRAQTVAIEKIEEFQRALDEARLSFEGKEVDFEALCKKIGLTFDVTGVFSRKTLAGVQDKLGYSQRFDQLVFGMEAGEYSSPVSTEKGWFLFRVARKLPAEPARLTDDVRRAVLKEIQTRKGRELSEKNARKFQEELIQKIEEKTKVAIPAEMKDADEITRKRREIGLTTLAELAAAQHLKVEKSDWCKRDGYLPGIKNYSREFVETTLALEPGTSTMIPSFQEVYVVVVDRKRPPDAAGFAAQRDFLLERLNNTNRSLYMKSWNELMQKNAALEDLTQIPRSSAIEGDGETGEEEDGSAEDHTGHDHDSEDGF